MCVCCTACATIFSLSSIFEDFWMFIYNGIFATFLSSKCLNCHTLNWILLPAQVRVEPAGLIFMQSCSHTTHSIMWSATKPMRCSFSTWTGVFVVVVSRHRFQQKKKMNINIWIRIWKRLQSTKKEWARKRRLQNERRKYCKRLDFCEQVCCLNVHQMQTYKCFWCYSQISIPIAQTVDWNCTHMQPYFWPIIFKWRHNLPIFAAIECDCKWKYMEFNI